MSADVLRTQSTDQPTDIKVIVTKAPAPLEISLCDNTPRLADALFDRDGQLCLLDRAQDELLRREAAGQAAILDALPAQVVLLDRSGVIVSVNEAWRQLAESNRFREAAHGVGANYLAVCDGTEGPAARGAAEIAVGIRSVLTGRSKRFATEYACDTPSGRKWYLLTVTPLDPAWPRGAMVMHVNVTAAKEGEQSLQRFTAAMDAAEDAIYLVDRATLQFIHFNGAACRLQNETWEQVFSGGPAGATGIPLAELERAYDALINGSVGELRELCRRGADGSIHWVEVRAQAHLLGENWTIILRVRDVTERKRAEQKIVSLNRVHAVLSGINSLIVRASSRAELFKEACRIAVDAGGFAMAWIGILDRGALEIMPVASVGATEALLECFEQGLSVSDSTAISMTPSIQVVRERKPIIINDAQMAANPEFAKIYAQAGIRAFGKFPLLVGDEAVGLLALYTKETDFFNADEMKLLNELSANVAFAIDHIEKQERVEYLSLYDPLTGLANRTLFLDRVTQHVRSAENTGHKVAMVLIDLERFRNVNDTLGRPMGDALLKQVAAWLTQSVGDPSRVARLGADQFALVLANLDPGADPALILDRTVNAFLRHSFHLNEMPYRLAAKTGVALFPEDGVDADTLFRNAEAALKQAKASGDRYLFYSRTMRETLSGRLGLENQLRLALERNEFVLHYQPKVCLLTGKLMGAEALIRWNDPHTGLVPPGRFIPILEETGLIYEVGRWALRKAVEDYLCWHRAGLNAVRIAVNVSPLQLGSPGFVSDIEKVIGIDPLAAAGLELEITESLIMADVRNSILSLQKIRSMGVTVAIDDFGTAFSSLSYLAKLPVNTLKIDRSFVVELTSGPEASALVSMIIKLAHSLRLNVVAEGVETDEQSRELATLGCDQMQGFLFSKPIPEAAFAARFLSGCRTPEYAS